MIVMIEASTHTIANIWRTIRELEAGDTIDRSAAAGARYVLKMLGEVEPQEKPE